MLSVVLIFYKAAAADSKDELERLIQEARSQGIDFGKKTNQMLRESRCLPLVSTVAAMEIWNAEIVRERTLNIAELLFEEMSDWLGGY